MLGGNTQMYKKSLVGLVFYNVDYHFFLLHCFFYIFAFFLVFLNIVLCCFVALLCCVVGWCLFVLHVVIPSCWWSFFHFIAGCSVALLDVFLHVGQCSITLLVVPFHHLITLFVALPHCIAWLLPYHITSAISASHCLVVALSHC